MILNNKKILTADFSIDEMKSIASHSDARKYFILKFFVPIVVTKLGELVSAQDKDWATLHIARLNGVLFPIISIVREGESGLELNQSNIERNDNLFVSQNYVSAVGNIHIYDLSDELFRVFDACFPANHSTLSCNIKNCPLIATINNKASTTMAGHSVLSLNVLSKTIGNVPEAELLNTGHHRYSSNVVGASEEYKRAYNKLTGKWLTLCDPDDGCEDCNAILNSPVRNGIYDVLNAQD